MQHVIDLDCAVPTLPASGWTKTAAQLASTTAVHVIAVSTLLLLFSATPPSPPESVSPSSEIVQADEVRHIVFIASEPQPSGGGGGGGNRQLGPIRHAEGVGADSMTLRVTRKKPESGPTADLNELPHVFLDARPLASGSFDQVGLPVGGVAFGTSTGPGSGGGVGTGEGTGIGSGQGPGIGPGSGGGMGGGVYRPGGTVSPPRVLKQVKPTYTADALSQRIQGTVVLELVVRANGVPSDLRVIRSLDAGLDAQAMAAAGQWRFEPGRLAGNPVDVLVIVMLDFWIL